MCILTITIMVVILLRPYVGYMCWCFLKFCAKLLKKFLFGGYFTVLFLFSIAKIISALKLPFILKHLPLGQFWDHLWKWWYWFSLRWNSYWQHVWVAGVVDLERFLVYFLHWPLYTIETCWLRNLKFFQECKIRHL